MKTIAMKNVIKIFTVGTVLFSALLYTAESQQKPTRTAPRENRRTATKRPQTAPKIVPGSTAAMQTPEFWINNIKGDPDKVIMTPVQIRELNEKNKKRGSNFTDVFGDPYSIDRVLASKDNIGIMYHVENPLEYTTFPSDSLRFRIERSNSNFERRNLYDRRNMLYDEDMKNELIEMTNVDAIPEESVMPSYGIIVKHTNGRVMPTELKATGGPGGWTDNLQSGMVDYGSPVAILHTSKDGDWYYVRSQISFVWVPATHVAIGTHLEIGEYIDSSDFIVATCHKVPIYADHNFRVFVEDFYLGAKLKLIEKTVMGNKIIGYKVSFPYRKPDGSFGTADGWIKPDARVSVGYQPFTQRNIIDTVFTMLYRPYGWADSDNERDCCGMARTVLRSVGIYTGRWTSHQLHASDHVVMFPRKTPVEKKYDFLEDCEGGICLVGGGGHISMYLGEVNGKHYVIHSSGYSYTAEDGTRMNVNRVNVNDTDLAGGSNIRSWTEITTLKP